MVHFNHEWTPLNLARRSRSHRSATFRSLQREFLGRAASSKSLLLRESEAAQTPRSKSLSPVRELPPLQDESENAFFSATWPLSRSAGPYSCQFVCIRGFLRVQNGLVVTIARICGRTGTGSDGWQQ